MNFIRIFNKEIKHNMRETKGNVMMVLFPIVLIIILGMALSGAFSNSVTLNDVKVLYTNQAGTELTQAFESFVKHGEEMGISFEQTQNVQEGMDSIKDVKYSCYVLIKENPREIKLYKNDRYNFEANFVETILFTFVERYNVVSEISRENPSVLGKIMTDTDMSFVTTRSLDKERQPTSTDYYAVTMLTMILMYSSLTGFWSIKNEQNLKTGNRILSSPVRKHEILIGKVFGSIFVTILQALVVIAFSKFVLKTYWGDNIGIVLLIVITEAVMAVSLGTGIAFAVESQTASTGILNTVIPIVVFLGGGYIPFNIFRGVLLKLSAVSPIRWINQAIFRVIYNNDLSLVPVAVLINLVIAAVFIITASVVYRKEAV